MRRMSTGHMRLSLFGRTSLVTPPSALCGLRPRSRRDDDGAATADGFGSKGTKLTKPTKKIFANHFDGLHPLVAPRFARCQE
jgi:hypothetical protein